MQSLLLGVALFFAAMLFSSNGSANAQEAKSANEVNWNGNMYKIEYEISNNAAAVSEIQLREEVVEITLSYPREDGLLKIWLPMALIKDIFSYGITSPTHQYVSIFIDGEEIFPAAARTDCEVIAMEVPF